MTNLLKGSWGLLPLMLMLLYGMQFMRQLAG